jgi:hypothetical protein
MFTRSTMTPGTVRRSAHGSRDVGMLSSSACVKFVDVPIDLESTMGDSPLTVMVSWTVATFIVKVRSRFDPTDTVRFSRTTRENPGRSTVTA